MDESYLIPANSKKSKLILGLFRPIDLGILASGVVVTLVLIMLGLTKELWQVIITLLPAGICAFLVMPVPNYHNVLVVIMNIFRFFTQRRVYIWRGWCIYDDDGFK